MKLAIFGASVSDQTVHHKTGEVTGYPEVLRREYAQALGVTEIRQITYPGNRLSDGGLVRLADVLDWRPDICLFEPLIEDTSRGRNSLEVENRYIYLSLLEAGILPVTLLLPEPFGRQACEIPHYSQYMGICRQYALPVIVVTLDGVPDLESKFTGVHTRLAGARIYAEQIVRELQGFEDPRQSQVTVALDKALAHGRPQLAVAAIPGADNPAKRIWGMRVEIEVTTPEPRPVRLVQRQNIGDFSPVLDVTVTRPGGMSDMTEQVSVWNPYCHYTHKSYVMLANLRLASVGRHTTRIAVSATRPDYSSCRRPHIVWPMKQYLDPIDAPVLISSRPIDSIVTYYDLFDPSA